MGWRRGGTEGREAKTVCAFQGDFAIFLEGMKRESFFVLGLARLFCCVVLGFWLGQSVSQSVGRPVDRSVGRSIGRRIGRSVSRSLNRP